MNGLLQIYYGSAFILSLIFAAIYIYMWHKHFNVNLTMIFTIVPISCLGMLLAAGAKSVEAAIIGLKINYIGGTFLQLFILFSIFSLCQFELKKWVRTLLFGICVALYFTVLTIGNNDLFYRSAEGDFSTGELVLIKEYGVMHTVFFVVVLLFFLVGLTVIVYSWLKKKQVPRTIIALLAIPDVICVLGFFLGKRVIPHVEVLPIGFLIAEIIYLLIAYRINLYNISDTVIDSMLKERKMGYLSVDFSFRYLGSNETGKEIVPELKELAVDDVIGYKEKERKIRHFLEEFKKNPESSQHLYNVKDPEGKEENDRIYNVNINYLYDGVKKRGYILTFVDDTANRKYIQLMDAYNESLQEEVEKKTQSIVDMHDNLIMSLAMMVESRDNSTGGHIKRTREGVRLLVDELAKEEDRYLSPRFCKDMIKAAPMHDLGKIAVDDAVLRKPGRFTPEEYEKMKHHAAEGGRIIHEILLHTDDEEFKKIAENVAHYHHERWDGSGYPEGLSGTQIPIEARIMAIADVYDALVSRRVYKEAFDFEKANNIILEGMGTQFDPGLKAAYEKARPRLEEYYASLQEAPAEVG